MKIFVFLLGLMMIFVAIGVCLLGITLYPAVGTLLFRLTCVGVILIGLGVCIWSVRKQTAENSLNSGVVEPTVEVAESDEPGDEPDEEDQETKDKTRAARIAMDQWTVIRQYCTMISFSEGNYWYLLNFLKNNDGQVEKLVVTNDHKDYLNFFLAKEGDRLNFEVSDECLSNVGEYNPSDYLRTVKPETASITDPIS